MPALSRFVLCLIALLFFSLSAFSEPSKDRNPSNKYWISFNTTDKQTGIDHYEIMEEPLTQFGSFQWGRADAPWIEERSPYVLDDQSLNSIIRVKAIDKAGNEYIANLIPDESMRTLSRTQVMLIATTGVGIIIFLILGFFTVRYLKKKKRNIGENDVEKEDDFVGDDANEEDYEN